MSTIFILLDAFRNDYLNEATTPFLWKCAQEGEHYQRVVQSMGFCERTEILTGMQGDESGFFTAIGFDPLNSPYNKVKLLFFFHLVEQVVHFALHFIPRSFGNKIRSRLRSREQRHFRKHGIRMPSYFIPYKWLRFFALTEDRIDHRNPTAFPCPTLLTRLTDAGKTYFYDSFTALGLSTPYDSDQKRLDAVRSDLSGDRKDFYLIYISIPDSKGHRYGPESDELRDILREMDEMLHGFAQQAEKAAPGNTYVFTGDHGMLTVTAQFDAEAEIQTCMRKAGMKAGKDIVYFLDSTMVRFWMMNDHARDAFPTQLKNSMGFKEQGRWMDLEYAERNHVPWPDTRYGEYLWVANPGVQVFPDFFHRLEPCSGMHGYDPTLSDSQGMCIRWGKGIKPKQQSSILLADVYDILAQSLSL